jgi:protoporphyrin/coproporphyrin ferrochelatase
MKKAILLINLGTPDKPDNQSVYRYLKEFLNDPRVIDLPSWLRWSLVNLFIVPFRYKKSAAAYRKIWENQSPLLTYTARLRDKLAVKLGSDYQVEFGMRYGHPSIESALEKFHDPASIHIIPLFPQYASAATGSAIEVALQSISQRWNIPAISITRDFYQEPGFIQAYANAITEALHYRNIDLILFSYHGLPERHINKSHCIAECDRLNACPPINATNFYCYRAQCYATTEAIAKTLNLPADKYTVSFQSRLGRTPWIKPYTDLVLPQLIKQGIKNIAVVCPSFVADCLETLEEINIRAREQWQQLGGGEFIFVPCLNDRDEWVEELHQMVIAGFTGRDKK